MMDLPCAVVRDLLPLYAEELTGEETSGLVREHLEGCADCRAAFEKTKEPAAPPAPESAEPLRALKKDIRKRRLRAAGIAALAVFLVLVTLFARATAWHFLPYDVAQVRVEGVQPYDAAAASGAVVTQGAPVDGSYRGDALVLSYDERVVGMAFDLFVDDETGESTLYLQGWSNRLGLILDGEGLRLSAFEREPDSRAVCYPVPDRVIYGWGNEQTLLYGEPMNGGVQILPRLVLGYYAMIAAALAAVLGLLWLLLRRKKAAAALRQLFFVPASYLIGHLLIKGTNTLSFQAGGDLLPILLAAAAVYGLLTLLWSSLRQRREDRA